MSPHQFLRELAQAIRAGGNKRVILRQWFVSGAIHESGAGNQDSCAGAAAIQAVDQMMGAEDVGGERRLGTLPGLSDMGCSRAVIYQLGFEAAEGRPYSVAVQQVDRFTRDPVLLR